MKKLIMSFMALIFFTALVGIFYPQSVDAEETTELKTLVFHYLRFDEDYENVGLYFWNTGTGGSNVSWGNFLEKTGVDDFGAYFEIKIGEGATDVGIIPVDITDQSKASFEGKDLIADVRPFFDEENPVDIMHVFFMENGSDVYYFEGYDPENMNYVYVIYAERDGRYEGWGMHLWDTGTNGTGTTWGNFHPFGATAYTKTFSFPFKLGIIAVGDDAADTIGFIPTNGSEQTADIKIDVTDLKAEGPQGKIVYYIYKAKGSVENDDIEESKEAFFEKVNDFKFEFRFKPYNPNPDVSKQETIGTYAMSPNAIHVEFNQDVIVTEEFFDPSFFTLKDKDGNEYELVVNYLDHLDVVNEFVITFKDENFRLDHTNEYTLYFDNGLEDGDLAQQKAEIIIDMDKEAPEIELISGKTIIEIKQYEKFEFPNYAAKDNRDGDITGKVYVPEGKGYLDTGKAGDQKITLAVSDDWGHVTELEITIRVLPVETKKLSTGAIIGIIAGGVVVVGGAGALIFVKRKSA